MSSFRSVALPESGMGGAGQPGHASATGGAFTTWITRRSDVTNSPSNASSRNVQLPSGPSRGGVNDTDGDAGQLAHVVPIWVSAPDGGLANHLQETGVAFRFGSETLPVSVTGWFRSVVAMKTGSASTTGGRFTA